MWLEQEARKMAAEVDYRGVCIVRADASDLIRPYDRSVSRTPEISSVAMTSTVQLPLSDSDVASLGGAFPDLLLLLRSEW